MGESTLGWQTLPYSPGLVRHAAGLRENVSLWQSAYLPVVLHGRKLGLRRVGQARLELNTMEPVFDDEACTARLVVHEDSEIITPEPIQRSLGTREKPATIFYPDAGLWSMLPRLPYQPGDLESPFGLEPDGLDSVGTAHPGVFGPVETFWAGVQEIRIRPASTERWNRREAPSNFAESPSDLIDSADAETPSAAGGGL